MELYHYSATVRRVIDGDTVDLTVDAGFHTFIDIRVRLLGINAPERYATGGREATAFLSAMLPVGATHIVRTYKDPTDKYGRWIADIFVGGTTVSSEMIAAGHALPASY